MKCPLCHSENPTSSKYCGNCSAPLSAEAAPGVGADEEGSGPGLSWPTHDPSPHVLATDRLIGGKYEIAEEIGRGGMGVVYKARDVQLKRWVALKFLPSSLAESEEFRERFLIEAQAAAALSHPNICVIHEVGEDQGQPFIAMEYVEGETLRQKNKRESFKTEEAVALIGQVAAGLDEAHRKGIIHRDIKSANIMVTEKGQAKIMDFGLAKLEGGPSLTATQSTLGTAGYMSPEQAAGEEVDQRTDIWSAGVVLYELLTGELPFRGAQEVVVVHSILHEDPKPLADRTPPVPMELQRVVERALKKKLEARYASAEEMAEDLRKYQDELRADAAGVLNLRSLVRRLREPKVAVPTALGAAALAVLAVWFTQRQADVRWAREVALPEVERLIGENDVWRNLVSPYRLAVQAEQYIPDDPQLSDLFRQVSREINVLTEPAGASVYMKEYGTPEAEWVFLGVTPLEGVRVPIGIFRWKLEKEGYETVLAAESTWNVGGEEDLIAGYDLVRTLDEEGSLPPGMVRVAATQTPLGLLDDFFIGRHEVTNREYKEFVDAGGYRNREYWKFPFVESGRELTWEEAQTAFVDQAGQPGPFSWIGGDYPQGQADHPVSGVSWYEAAAYAEYAGMSLPTAVHWNVARGRFTPVIQWPQLGGFGVLAPFANFGGQGTLPVGSLPGFTAYGAYDMPGNVREWCWNETSEGRVVRGGAWEDNTYAFGNEADAPPMDRSARNGFRLALYPDPNGVPEALFGVRNPRSLVDFRARSPVSDAVFEVYKDQYSYDPTPLNAQVEFSEESVGGWTHELISFDAAYGGERVLAHLFLPANAAPPFQTVVYFPGSAAAMMPSSEGLEGYYEFTMFLSYLVRNGRAVLFPVYKGTFERGSPELMVVSNPDASGDTRAYAEYLTQAVKDFRRSIDYLETRPDIDGERLAYYGMSWGGYLGAIIPALEERLKASVLVAGGLVEVGRPEASGLTYVSRVTTPTLILNGEYDVIFSPETSSRPLLDLLGTPDEDKRLILYETDHIPPRTEYIKESLAWLDKYLGPVGGE